MSIRQLWIRSAGILLALSLSACGAGADGTERGFELKFSSNDTAVPADAGLPAYPGAKPYKDSNDDSSAANIGFSSSLFGLKVVAMDLQTTDAPEQVARFYHRALEQYGPVLECSNRVTRNALRDDDLSCDDDDDSDKRKVVYKVGSKDRQRLVAIEPHGSGTRFSLVRVEVRGSVRADEQS